MSKKFDLVSNYKPAGDQPRAIKEIVKGLNDGLLNQTLLGVTGSGKTFTMANVIQEVQRPAIVMAHNKTLADSSTVSLKNIFRITQSNILFLITIIISPKLMFQPQISISKRMHPLMNI